MSGNRWVGVVAAVCLVTGCTAGGEADDTVTGPASTGRHAPVQTPASNATLPQGDPFAPTPEEIAAGAGYVSPFDVFADNKERDEVIRRAAAILLTTCVREHGLDVLPGVDEAARGELEPDPVTSMPDLGFEDYNPRLEQWRETLPEDTPAPSPDPKFNTPEYKLVMSGNGDREAHPPPTGQFVGGKEVYRSGCDGWADDQIYGEGVSTTDRRIRPILDAAYERQMSDPRYTEVLGKWQTCMRTRGYEFRFPGEAGNYMDTAPPDQANAAAKQARQATFECEREVGYGPVLYQVTKEWDAAVAEERALEIQEIVRDQDAQTARAASIIEENS